LPANKGIQLDQVIERVAIALKAWHRTGGTPEELLADLLIVQEQYPGNPNHETPAIQRLTTNRVLAAGIDELERQAPQLAQLLRLRFVDQQKLWAVANTMAVSEQTVSRLQSKAIQQLASILTSRESARRTEQAQAIEATLPPATYTQLFGVVEAATSLLNLLADAQGPAVVAVIGLGGIGKTALTDLVVRQIVHRFYFHKVVWLRIAYQTLSGQSRQPELTIESILTGLVTQIWPAQAEVLSPQQRLHLLRQELNSRPHLIVIDNLENQIDTDYLLDQLRGFTRPTKFLLTSRFRLAEQSAVFNFRLPELSLADATAFVRYHAQECGILPVAAASDSDIAAIYDRAGGNPLALKLIVSLLDVLPLPEILAGLTHSQADPIRGVYQHIYRQSWRSLTQDGRTLLQAMPLVSESGGTPQYLMTVSGLSKERLWPALHELHSRSLIEARGSVQEKRYGIHRLTNSFLCSEIIHLPEWS
jgi:hypothetical protein